jgi:hypothetical protein
MWDLIFSHHVCVLFFFAFAVGVLAGRHTCRGFARDSVGLATWPAGLHLARGLECIRKRERGANYPGMNEGEGKDRWIGRGEMGGYGHVWERCARLRLVTR